MTAPLFKCSDPDQITVIVVGIDVASGFGSGTFLSVKRNKPLFTIKVGPTGDVTRVKTADNSAVATLVFQQSSDSNAKLSALAAVDQAQPNGAGVGPFLVRDRAGTSILAAEHCWIQKKPDYDIGDDVADRTWEIGIADLVDFIGGN